MPRFTFNDFSGNSKYFLQGIDVQIKQIENQQGGKITDPESLNDVLASMNVQYGNTVNPKLRQQIYSKILDVQNQQMKLYQSNTSQDATQIANDWNDTKSEIMKNPQYLGSAKNAYQMVQDLNKTAQATRSQLVYDAYKYYDQTGKNDLIKKYSSAISKIDDDISNYNDIIQNVSSLKNDDGKTINQIAADNLKGYGFFYNTDAEGRVKNVDIRKVATADSKKQVQGVSSMGMGIFLENDPTVLADGTLQNRLGNLTITKSNASSPYDQPSGIPTSNDPLKDAGNFDSQFSSLNMTNTVGNYIKNEKSGQVYGMGKDNKWHPIDEKTFSTLDSSAKDGLEKYPDSFFQKQIVGNIGKDWNSYLQDQAQQIQQTPPVQKSGIDWGKIGKTLLESQTNPALNPILGGTIKAAEIVAPQAEKAVKSVGEFASGAGKYIGNKIIQAGENIFKGGK